MKKVIRLGTRGSPLAIVQAEDVKQRLYKNHPHLEKDAEIEIVPIRTSGDWRPEHKEQTFVEMGGNKGLFTKEIEEALQARYIDMAVHSMKDVSSWLPDDLNIAAILDRADPRDAFISYKARSLAELPAGSIVGTSSLRRQSQILAHYPSLQIVPLRGNVDTRLKKMADGAADATLLAVAGMTRLRVMDRIASVIDTDVILPAAAQGAIGVEIRHDDEDMRQYLAPLNDQDTAICISAERAMLQLLDGSCHTPIGALARIVDQNQILLEGLIAKPDGTAIIRQHIKGPVSMAKKIGTELGQILKSKMPLDFFAA